MPIAIETSVISPIFPSRTLLLGNQFFTTTIIVSPKTSRVHCKIVKSKLNRGPVEKEKKEKKKTGKVEHHLWKRKDSAQSGQKALTLVRTICELPNEKEAVYGALDKWTAWETEFPLIAVAKALNILRKRVQWVRVIQLAKWMLSKGQGATMGTHDTLLRQFGIHVKSTVKPNTIVVQISTNHPT